MKTEWKKVKLGDLATTIQPGPFGSQLHSSDYSDEGTPIIMPKDMIDGKVKLDSLARVPEKHLQRLVRHQVFDGDLMVARKGDVRKCIIITKDENGWLTGSDCLKVCLNKEKAFPKFIYYQLKSPFIGKWLETISIGATMPSINTTLLGSIELSLPPLETQQKIAGILSAYDDLIENNRKQIKLLEEAAQKLYKEWFVKLNFPDHENVKIVDGVPEGWKKGSLLEIGEFKRGKTITKDQTIEGTVPVVAGGLEPAYYHNESNTETPVITVSGSGANAGFTRLYYEKVWASDCSFLDISKCKNLYFVYCVLKSSTDVINNLQKGAAQPHVYAKDLNALQVLIPTDLLFEKFSKVVSPYFEKIKSLQKQNQLLQTTRDILLPGLMNGEITNSNIGK